MEKKTLKIGQIVTVTEDFETRRILSNEIDIVRKGDKAIVKANGWIEYVTGDSIGMMQKLGDEFKVVGYDTENIAERLIRGLERTILADYIDREDEEFEYIREEIESTLYQILI